MAEPIEMLVWLWDRVGSRKHLLDVSPDNPVRRRGSILREKGADGPSAVSCAKSAEPIEVPFRMLNRVSPGNHVLHGVQIFPREGAL